MSAAEPVATGEAAAAVDSGVFAGADAVVDPVALADGLLAVDPLQAVRLSAAAAVAVSRIAVRWFTWVSLY